VEDKFRAFSTKVVVVLGGVVVIVISIGPKVRGFKPEDVGFLRSINIRSTTSFGGSKAVGPVS
jgi:hypothetical protein